MKNEISSTELLQQIKIEHPGRFADKEGMLTMRQSLRYIETRTGKRYQQSNLFNEFKKESVKAVFVGRGSPSYYRLADIEQFCIGLLEVMK